MEKKNKTAIFFDDLKESAQERLIIDAMHDILQDKYIAVRSIEIDPNLYGYDEDPAKQTLEQQISVGIVINRMSQPWLFEWNCLDKEFTTVIKATIESDDDLTDEEKDEKNRIMTEIMECNGDRKRACKHLGYDINEFLHKLVMYNI